MAGDINLEDAKSGGPPRACYPDICFAVDNYEEAFQVVVGRARSMGMSVVHDLGTQHYTVTHQRYELRMDATTTEWGYATNQLFANCGQ